MAEQAPIVGMQRKLAAIFSTDVAGYSRLMGDDEEATIRTLTAYRALISSLIQQYRGRVVDSPRHRRREDSKAGAHFSVIRATSECPLVHLSPLFATTVS